MHCPSCGSGNPEEARFCIECGVPLQNRCASCGLENLPRAKFCAACGTPLSFRRIGGPRIEIMTGTFDRPDQLVPTRQFGTESRLGWVVGIANLPSQTTLQNYGPEKLGTIVSHQHPDHD